VKESASVLGVICLQNPLYIDGYAVAFVLVDGVPFLRVELKTFKDRVFPIFRELCASHRDSLPVLVQLTECGSGILLLHVIRRIAKGDGLLAP
jgi:hypothetical protein